MVARPSAAFRSVSLNATEIVEPSLQWRGRNIQRARSPFDEGYISDQDIANKTGQLV